MTNFFKGIRNLAIGCLAVIGALTVMIFFFVIPPKDNDETKVTATPIATPAVIVPLTPDQSSARQLYIPAIAVVATPDIQATQESSSAREAATIEAIEVAVTATAVANMVARAATQEAQQAAIAQATTAARVSIPPEGSWCTQNSSRAACVSNFRYETEMRYESASPSSRYIALFVAVKNLDSVSIYANPNDLSIVMSDGRTYSYHESTFSYWNMPFEGGDIAPGNIAEGGIVFYVPNDVAPHRLIYRGLWESEIVVDLTDPPIE